MAAFKLFSREKDGSGVILINLDQVVAVEQGAGGGTVFRFTPAGGSGETIAVSQPFEEVAMLIGVRPKG
jgi:hypothetical protein